MKTTELRDRCQQALRVIASETNEVGYWLREDRNVETAAQITLDCIIALWYTIGTRHLLGLGSAGSVGYSRPGAFLWVVREQPGVTVIDAVLSWLVCLLPRRLCVRLWRSRVRLGGLAPRILGRVLGATAHRVERKPVMQRREFEMTEDQHAAVLNACKPVPYIALQCGEPPSPQENANQAWARLGAELGFEPMTVEPVRGKGTQFFTAVPRDTPPESE